MAGRDDLNSEGTDPDQMHEAEVEWGSLTTTCEEMAFEVVESARSPREAWRDA